MFPLWLSFDIYDSFSIFPSNCQTVFISRVYDTVSCELWVHVSRGRLLFLSEWQYFLHAPTSYNWRSGCFCSRQSIVGHSRSRHSKVKGGRMIVLQNTNLPLSTDFFMGKETLFFQNADIWGSNGTWTLILQNADTKNERNPPYE